MPKGCYGLCNQDNGGKCVWCKIRKLEDRAGRIKSEGGLEHVVLNAIQKCEGMDEKSRSEVIAKHVREYFGRAEE